MLEIIDIWKSYESQPLLRGISISLAAHETVCLLGASGSGKSTLLRIIAGLEMAEQGQVCWDGQDLANVPAHLRHFGLVFQDYALFPHLDVGENVGFGLKMANWPAAEVNSRVSNLLEQVNLSGFVHRRVTDLSGGEQQRVALARALAPNPRLLMFDEPLGALDRSLRERLMQELRNILHTTGVPAIYVTHDQEEAFVLADRVLMLHEGQIVRAGTPAEIWKSPGSAWVARFLDIGNVLAGTLHMQGGKSTVVTGAGAFEADCGPAHREGEQVELLIRPQGAKRAAEGTINSKVTDVLFQQDRFKVTLASGLYFYLPEAPEPGQDISLEIPTSAVQCLA